MLHFAFAQVVQMGTPLTILFKVVRHMLGQKNVPGVPAIHHSLGQVDSRSRYIGAIIHIGNPADRTAVDSHAHPQLRMAPQCIANLYRAGNWGVRRCGKDQRHSVAGRQARQFASSIGCAERIGLPNNFIERMQIIALLIDQELGVTDDVDEEDMGDLQFDLFLNFSGHSGTYLVVVFGEFLEARIIPERIEHGIEPEQRGSEWHV